MLNVAVKLNGQVGASRVMYASEGDELCAFVVFFIHFTTERELQRNSLLWFSTFIQGEMCVIVIFFPFVKYEPLVLQKVTKAKVRKIDE